MLIALALATVVLGWALHLRMPSAERARPTDAGAMPGEAQENSDAHSYSPAPDRADATGEASENSRPVDVHERERFNERAREFFAQAAALSPEEARQRASDLSRELSRIERAGGLSAGETFLLRAGLIQATVADEREQLTQIRALMKRYEVDARQRNAHAAAQSNPMFQLYKVRESQIVAETMALEAIPNGLTRDEYLRRRLQAEREQLLGDAM
jgi:hypothetical protein